MKDTKFDLEQIQRMWTEDSVINQDELDTESLRVPQLHAKYFNIYNVSLALRKNAERQHNTILLERRRYYQGKAEDQVYIDEPFPYKVRDKEDLKLHLDTDERLQRCKDKIDYYDMMLRYIEDILKQISNRTYQIKNAIEWRRFTAGYG